MLFNLPKPAFVTTQSKYDQAASGQVFSRFSYSPPRMVALAPTATGHPTQHPQLPNSGVG